MKNLLFLVLIEFLIHFVSCSHTDKQQQQPPSPPPPVKVYDFIFGFSTGHVGTTTLSEKRFYGSPKNVQFLHELKYGKFDLDESFLTERWKNSTFEDEYDYVKNVYIPFMVKSRRGKDTLVDLGHNINYFTDALIQYLQKETHYNFIFVRIRRERIESAISLAFAHPDKPYDDLCFQLITRYCPWDRVQDVQLVPPSKQVYEAFNVYQQAFWLVDETEMRWIRLLRDYPDMNYIEVFWGKLFPMSMERAALSVAKLIGLSKIEPFDQDWSHMDEHQHAGNLTVQLSPDEISQYDHKYQIAMKYTYLPG